jgi:hypothetical protein
MARTHDRAPGGERLIAPVPYGHSHNDIPVWLRQDGLVAPGFSIAPSMAPGSCLHHADALSRAGGGDLDICDNLTRHKVTGARETIQACGASLLYLPPYRPDLNPIELAFSSVSGKQPQHAPSMPSGTPSDD